METNEPESESLDSSLPPIPTPPSSLPSITQPSVITVVPEKETTKPLKLEVMDVEKLPVVSTPTTIIPVISSNKPPVVSSASDSTPLNVSIRLPDDLNERKNLIKRNIDQEIKDVKLSPENYKFSQDLKKEVKVDSNLVKLDEMKEDLKEVPDKFKTELIIPKVVTIDKVVIKEEVTDSSNEAINMNLKEDSNSNSNMYKENIYVPQNLNVKEQMGYGLKEPHMNHYPSSHPLNLKDPQLEQRQKEQVLGLNPAFVKETNVKSETSFGFGQPPKENLSHPLAAMVKLEPRDEPMELTNPRQEVYSQNIVAQPLNIPTVIPLSQMQAQRPESHYEEEKRMERSDKLPERQERQELSMGSAPIGQPPLPSMMQSNNLVTIGGGQPSINHYGYLPNGPYNPHSPRNIDKNLPHMVQPLVSTNPNTNQIPGATQNEPQNLKIKQEVPDSIPPTSQTHITSMPPYSQSIPPTSIPLNVPSSSVPNSIISPQVNQITPVPSSNLTQSSNGIPPASPGVFSSISSQPNVPTGPPLATDPLQSLKDVKVPGFNIPSAVTQPASINERPSSGSTVEIKKEQPEYPVTQNIPSVSPAQPPSEKSPVPKSTSGTSTPGAIVVSQTPPLRQPGMLLHYKKSDKFIYFIFPGTNSPQTGVGHSAINLISPSSGLPPPSTLSQPVLHPSQQSPFPGQMHPPPPHPLMHHSFLHAMHQFHSHPYSGYPFSYPYPYGMSQPHPIPPQQPPTSRPEVKSTIESSTTMISSQQHTTSSQLTARREIREPDENGTERHQTHETTLTHHQSTSHHSAVHSSTEKQGYGGTNHSITISHSTSSSSSQSLQHKVNQKTVRTSSPHTPASQVSIIFI